ncbi:MAG: hypothetical protein KDB40_10710 [Acidimicrobiales bacterium]|nr:hypothetical protein [Acidimicrobiales bacterium]MCB9395747.1 hypothetical protein [Acidimicrobiaceae bacterium]
MASRPATVDAPEPPRRARLSELVLGPPAARRLTLAHGLDDVADSAINLSLVGSLFFSVSLEASRSRILLYLLLTAAPLALVAPLVGPLLDRLRAGYRGVVVASQLVRALLALALASSLLSLAFYPLVFGVLLSRKAYALAKTALLPQLVPERHELVRASGHLARVGTVLGGAGTAVAGGVIAIGGVTWLPLVAAAGYLVAALVSTTIDGGARPSPVAGAIVRAETPPSVRQAAVSVAALRAASGALTFLLALAIKRGGGDEWIFAAALVAAGVGSFLGTMVSSRLHRRLPTDRVILLALVVPGVISAFGVLTIGSGAIVAIAATIGLAGSVASRTMDVNYTRVPDSVRGRVIAWVELGFQLANVTGAVLAVSAAPSPRLGFAVVAVVLVLAALATASRMRVSLRREAGRWLLGTPIATDALDLPFALLAEAVRVSERGDHRMAVVVADAAVRVASVADDSASTGALPAPEWIAVAGLVAAVVAGRTEASAATVVRVVEAADAAVRAMRPAVDPAVDPAAPVQPSSEAAS